VRMFGKPNWASFLSQPPRQTFNNWLSFPAQFSALDPCVGDGVAFTALLGGTTPTRYGIEIDAHRSAQAKLWAWKSCRQHLDVRVRLNRCP